MNPLVEVVLKSSANRLAAAGVAVRANVTSRTTMTLAVVAACIEPVLIMGINGHGSRPLLEGTVYAMVGAITLVITMGLICGLTTYSSATKADRDLLYLRTDEAQACVILYHRPDRGEAKVAVLSAWPKRKGAGKALGLAVLARCRAQGITITATAWPGLARKYREHGLYYTGKRRRGLIKLTSDPTKTR